MYKLCVCSVYLRSKLLYILYWSLCLNWLAQTWLYLSWLLFKVLSGIFSIKCIWNENFYWLIWKDRKNYRITYFSDFCFFASFLRYFNLFDMQIMKVSTSHVHYDLSKKVLLALSLSNEIIWNSACLVLREKHIHDSFKVIVFDKRKDIKPSSISHYVWRRNLDHLHIKQTEISQKQSKETKICQRGYSIVLKLPSHKADLIFVSYTL